MKILLDSDILLDFFFNREPYFTYSKEVLDLCEKKKVEGFITPVIFSNVYYLLRKNFSKETCFTFATGLMNVVDIISIDKSVVLKSLQSDFNDFEDALQNFSAESSGLKILLTRNLKDCQKSSLRIMTPENFLNTFNTL